MEVGAAVTADRADVYVVRVRGETVLHTTEFAEVVQIAIAAGATALQAASPVTWEATDGNGGIVLVRKIPDVAEDEWLA